MSFEFSWLVLLTVFFFVYQLHTVLKEKILIIVIFFIFEIFLLEILFLFVLWMRLLLSFTQIFFFYSSMLQFSRDVEVKRTVFWVSLNRIISIRLNALFYLLFFHRNIFYWFTTKRKFFFLFFITTCSWLSRNNRMLAFFQFLFQYFFFLHLVILMRLS